MNEIPDTELWYIHERRRRRLVEFARKRLIDQLKRRGSNPREIERAKEVLMPDALTIGFARRMATYKRGLLIFKDIDRLKTILSRKDRSVQIIVAGKAHPRDSEGKDIIQRIIHVIREDPFRDKVVFLEDYNMNSARYLVQGVDIWLNNPRRPYEACGTSGMKATANGALNLSIEDGWWDEGYAPGLGWSIGKDEKYDNWESQDIVESKAIYDLMEREIIPLFYERGLDGLPRGWISMMKKSMRTLCPEFNSNRMVEEYTDRCYMEAALNHKTLSAVNFKTAKDIVSWRNHLLANWGSVKVLEMSHEGTAEVKVDSELVISTKIQLGAIEPSQISARVYYGILDDANDLTNARDLIMDHAKDLGEGVHLFKVTLVCEDTGRFGYTVRIMPRHEHVRHPVDVGLIRWAEE
jgi:starch phosphorylase